MPKSIVGFWFSVCLTLAHPLDANAQAKGTISQNPANPLGVPSGPIANYTRPTRNGLSGRGLAPSGQPPEAWIFTLAASYQFLNDRSRTGGVSLTSQSAITDLTADLNEFPWSCLDFSYIYSHGRGSSPTGTDATVNQNVGSFRVLQPLSFFGQCMPATRTTTPVNDQLAVILSADYGRSLASENIPTSTSIHNDARTFLGTFLLDYQRAIFTRRNAFSQYRIDSETYPGWLIEISSGIQFNNIHLHSADRMASETSSGQQLTYQNIGSVTYSFSCGFGLLVAAEWDAPLYSKPLLGSQRFYANTALFTSGLVYNIYANKIAPGASSGTWKDTNWSGSLLYSYTAFNPLTETNQLQVQIAYSF